MGVLGHFSAFIGVEEDVVEVERGGNEGLLVGTADGGGSSECGVEGFHGPEALSNGAEIDINFNFVILYFTIYPAFRRI